MFPYHLRVSMGFVNPRILTVGDFSRAETFSHLLDKDPPVKSFTSERRFSFFCGCYKGVPVSIIAIGMGLPMVDIFMRELCAVTVGPLAIIRVGSCGLFDEDLDPGSVVVASKGSMANYINCAYVDGAFDGNVPSKPYQLTKAVPSNVEMSNSLYKNILAGGCPPAMVKEGLNISGETFYACQGRCDPAFNDENSYIVDEFKKIGVSSCEMETYTILSLAQRSSRSIKATASAIGVFNRVRKTGDVKVTDEAFARMAKICGKAALETLIATEL